MKNRRYKGLTGLAARRARREDTNWRRCDYCGRYMSYEDFEKKNARSWQGLEWNYTSDEPMEIGGAYHTACRAQEIERLKSKYGKQ